MDPASPGCVAARERPATFDGRSALSASGTMLDCSAKVELDHFTVFAVEEAAEAHVDSETRCGAVLEVAVWDMPRLSRVRVNPQRIRRIHG